MCARASEEAAEREVAEREQQLAQLRDDDLQLRTFLQGRATSADYRGQLGVISTVRRDFERLVTLLPHYRDLLEEPDSYLEKIFQIPYALRR